MATTKNKTKTDRSSRGAHTNSRAAHQRGATKDRGKGKRPVYPMISGLGAHTVDSVVNEAEKVWGPEGMSLYPGKVAKALKPAHQIRAWAADNRVEALADLTGDTAAAMLRELAGVRRLHKVTKPKQLARLHRLRNTLIALRGLILIVDNVDTRQRAHRPGQDSLAAGLPAIAPRSAQKRRPLEDDEILLGRTLVEIDLREDAETLPILAYLFAETGVRCQPSTAITTESLDDLQNPTKVKVQGVWSQDARKVKLDPYVSLTVSRVLARMPRGTRPLTYTGKQPGSAGAGASLTPVIQRFMRRAGIDSPEATQMSLVMWRPWHTLTTDHDIRRARKYHGGRTHNLLADIHCQLDEKDLDEGLLDVIHRPTGKTVARVRAKDARRHS